MLSIVMLHGLKSDGHVRYTVHSLLCIVGHCPLIALWARGQPIVHGLNRSVHSCASARSELSAGHGERNIECVEQRRKHRRSTRRPV